MTKSTFVNFRETVEIRDNDFQVFQAHAKTMMRHIDAASEFGDIDKNIIKNKLQAFTSNQTKFEQNAINCNDFEVTTSSINVPIGFFHLADWDSLHLYTICEVGAQVQANFVCPAVTLIIKCLGTAEACADSDL